MDSEPRPVATQSPEPRPATAPAAPPAPALEAFIAFAVLAAALAGCWLAYGHFIRIMLQFMARALLGEN